MKILLRILIFLFVLLIMLASVILCAREGYLDKPIKKLIVYYLSKEHIPAKLDGFHISHKGVLISHLSYPIDDNDKIELADLTIKLGRGTSLKNPVIEAYIEGNLLLSNNQNNVAITSRIIGQFYHKFFTKIVDIDLQLPDLKSNLALIPDQEHSSLGNAHCHYKSESAETNNLACDVHFDEQTYLSLQGQTSSKLGNYENIKADVLISNIPFSILRFIEKFADNNEVIKKLSTMIQSGKIAQGQLKIDLDESFFKDKIISPNNLNGKFKISDLEVKYLEEFPNIKKAQGEIVIQGEEIDLKITDAYSNNILLSNGAVKLEGASTEDIKLVIDADAKSLASEFTDFIPKDALNKLEQTGINLKKLKGSAKTKIHIIIPFKENTKNIFDITSEINHCSLAIFNDNVNLSNGELFAKFDGGKISLNGNVNINGFASEINYQFNLDDIKEFEQLLKIRTKIKNLYDNTGPIRMISGKSILNFEYKVKDNISTIKANSDLKDLNFKIEKLGIHKDYGQRAKFTLNAILNDNKNPISFSLTGEDNLKFIGNIFLQPNQKRISISSFTHGKTDINSEITFTKDEFKVRVRGECIDLANANLMSFLEKGEEGGSDAISNIKFNVKKIRLKNDIWLSNVALAMKCNKTRCIKGYLNSNVGSKFLKMLMKAYEDKEEWVITSDNAGAVFRAFDIYKNMRAGTMILTLNTSRQEVKNGEIVPILDGRFDFKRFVVTDTPFLTRMVSFVSLPGLFSTITNNKNIAFYEIKGKFSYDKDIIHILKGKAEGPYFDFGITGDVNTAKHHIALNGYVLPSMYGISSVVKRIPWLGKILLGGKHRGLFTAPFSIDQNY